MTFSKLKKTGGMSYLLMMSSIYGICSSSWVMVWVALEINMITMCWILSKESKLTKEKENKTMLYFLIQVMASAILILICSTPTNKWTQLSLLMCLCTKMGVWPLHLWYAKMIFSLEMKMNPMLIIMTWQKILPIMLMNSISQSKITLYIILLLSTMTLKTPLTKLSKKMSMKSILALSSINNNSWLVLTCYSSMKMFTSFLMLYSLTLMSTLKYMKDMTVKSKKMNSSFWGALTITANLGGVPPMTMFWAKIMTMKTMIMSTMSSEILMMLMTSACLMLYFYLWATSSETSSTPMKTQNKTKKETKKEMMALATISSTLGVLMILVLD